MAGLPLIDRESVDIYFDGQKVTIDMMTNGDFVSIVKPITSLNPGDINGLIRLIAPFVHIDGVPQDQTADTLERISDLGIQLRIITVALTRNGQVVDFNTLLNPANLMWDLPGKAGNPDGYN